GAEVTGEDAGVVDGVVFALDAEPLGAGFEREAAVAGTADVHTGGTRRRGERARQHVDRVLVAERGVATPPRNERGLVEEQDERRPGEALVDEVLDRRRPGACGFAPAPERLRRGKPAVAQREAQR